MNIHAEVKKPPKTEQRTMTVTFILRLQWGQDLSISIKGENMIYHSNSLK